MRKLSRTLASAFGGNKASGPAADNFDETVARLLSKDESLDPPEYESFWESLADPTRASLFVRSCISRLMELENSPEEMKKLERRGLSLSYYCRSVLHTICFIDLFCAPQPDEALQEVFKAYAQHKQQRKTMRKNITSVTDGGAPTESGSEPAFGFDFAFTAALDYAVETLQQRHANGHDLILATLTHCCTLEGSDEHYHDKVELPEGEGENFRTDSRTHSEVSTLLEASREHMEQQKKPVDGAKGDSTSSRGATEEDAATGGKAKSKWAILRRLFVNTEGPDLCTDANLNLDFPFLSLHLQQIGLHPHLWPQVFSNTLLLLKGLPARLETSLSKTQAPATADLASFAAVAQQQMDQFQQLRHYRQCRHTVLVLLHILRELLVQRPSADPALLSTAQDMVAPFLTWPAPYGTTARRLLQELNREIRLPGAALRQRLLREQPFLFSSRTTALPPGKGGLDAPERDVVTVLLDAESPYYLYSQQVLGRRVDRSIGSGASSNSVGAGGDKGRGDGQAPGPGDRIREQAKKHCARVQLLLHILELFFKLPEDAPAPAPAPASSVDTIADATAAASTAGASASRPPLDLLLRPPAEVAKWCAAAVGVLEDAQARLDRNESAGGVGGVTATPPQTPLQQRAMMRELCVHGLAPIVLELTPEDHPPLLTYAAAAVAETGGSLGGSGGGGGDRAAQGADPTPTKLGRFPSPPQLPFNLLDLDLVDLQASSAPTAAGGSQAKCWC